MNAVRKMVNMILDWSLVFAILWLFTGNGIWKGIGVIVLILVLRMGSLIILGPKDGWGAWAKQEFGENNERE